MVETGEPKCENGLRLGLSTGLCGVGFNIVLTSRALTGLCSGLVTEVAIDVSEPWEVNDVFVETG